MTTILLVEDDPRITSFVKRGLEAEGYLVEVADDGRNALALARDNEYQLIILDLMLPGLDGLDVCRALREAGSHSMILMLTAKDRLQDKIDGLAGGADDYLVKPFAFDELLARMRALLRRGRYQETAKELRVGELVLNLVDFSLKRGARDIVLTAKEFALLSYLMRNAGKVLSRAKLLSNVWGYSFEPGTKVVDVYIRYLRKKIDDGEESPLIHTVRGFGYKVAAPDHGVPRAETVSSADP